MRARFAAVLLGGALFFAPAMFGTVIYTASGDLRNGNDVDAEASFTFSADTIHLTLTNLITDQQDVRQDLNGISFTLPEAFAANIGVVTTFDGTDRSGITKNVAAGWTDSPDSTNHWFLTDACNVFDLTAIGNPGAAYTLVGGPNTGSDEYTQARANLDRHGPELAITATWTFTVPGVTAAMEAEIGNVKFSFGTRTNEGGAQIGILCDLCQDTTPEPFTLGLAGSGLLLIALRVRFGR